MKTTKRSALLSVMALFLCLTMLLGTTWAWFTDSVTSSGNKIQAGTLKLDLEMLNKETGAYESIKTSKDPIFNYNLWEPGYTDVKFLKVENEGSLSLQWKAMFVSDEEVSKLAEVIDVYVMPSVTELGYDNLTRDFDGWRRVGTLDQFINTLSETTFGNLLPYSCAYLGIALHMQEEAGNEYQEIGLEAFDIQIVATQMSNEEDSFGPDYDNDAEWPATGMNFSATQSLAGVSIINNELAEEVIIRHESGAYAIVPAGVKLADGVTELKFSGKGLDNEAGNFAEDSKNYDIHIEGIADDNTKCIKVFIGAILDKNLGETELKLYHEDVQMTRVNSVEDFAINNQFTYDPTTGAVVLYVDNFSVFSGVKTEVDEWDGTSDTTWYDEGKNEFTLTTAEQFAGFRDLVDGKVEGIAPVTFAGKTVKLGADIDLNNELFDPIGFGYTYNKDSNTAFMGTFDGGNHTIFGLYQNGWDLDPDKTNYGTYTYSTAGGGLFASIENATIKNLTVSGANIVFECVDIGIVVGYAQGNCHFENIVVTNSKIANYNRATGGVVGEVCYGSYGTDVKQGYSHTFENIVVDSSVVVSSLWGSFDTLCGGVIGGKWGDATVEMTNVISACELDVFSDVTAAYQWYAYRRCGMLIGHTEQNSPKSALNADAPFLTCKNVNVFYGDWVNYTYYQFADQKDAEGNSLWYSNYPWVRAEAGKNNGAFSNPRYGNPIVNGVAINTVEAAEALNAPCVKIKFDQLYGGGQGVYGKADHDGVETYHLDFNATTIYFQNSKGWENLKLQYKYMNGDDEWTTVVEGISLGDPVDTIPNHHIYKVTIPSDAYSFTITDGTNSTGEILLEGLVAGDLYALDGNDEIKHCDYNGEYNVIYFYNNKNWTNVSLYYWYENSDETWDTLGFPGEKMTSTIKDGNYDIYQFIVPAYAEAFIISDRTNDKQTQDISVIGSDGKIYGICDETTNNTMGVKAFKVGSSTYVAGYKTIYLKNGYKWDNVQAYYSIGNAWMQSSTVKLLGYDGTYEYYSAQIPNFATNFNFSGEKNNGTGSREETQPQTLSNFTSYNMITPNGTNSGKVTVSRGTYSSSVIKSNYRQLYIKPVSNWFNDGARLALYAFGSGEGWYSVADNYSGTYKVWIDTKYTSIIVCRMNGSTTANNWDNRWNQSVDIKLENGKNLWTMNSWSGGNSTGKWSTR